MESSCSRSPRTMNIGERIAERNGGFSHGRNGQTEDEPFFSVSPVTSVLMLFSVSSAVFVSGVVPQLRVLCDLCGSGSPCLFLAESPRFLLTIHTDCALLVLTINRTPAWMKSLTVRSI